MAKIIAGNACKDLASKLSQILAIELANVKIEHFADGELKVQINEHLHNQSAIIIQSTCAPTNEHLIELLLLIDAAKHAAAAQIIVVIPYFGYSRQDRLTNHFSTISAKLVAKLLETAGANQVITLDLHSKLIEGFFNIAIKNIDPSELFASKLKGADNSIIVSPDAGGINRAKKLASYLNLETAIIEKKRKSHNICEMHTLTGNVVGKNCIIIDDIIDTGETIMGAVNLLKNNGALACSVVASHAVFSKCAIEKLQNSGLNQIMITATIPHNYLPDKFTIIDTIPLIAETLKNFI